MVAKENIRNFCIIAHIDHGKSTLADRLIEMTATMDRRQMKHGQMLDTMELEQERGITIKLQPIRMTWRGHQLNLIDTPGHVDFSYEVSRSLAAVDGAILVVDATQGIEAQTLTTLYMAMEHDLTIVPVLNKIDLPAADPERVSKEIEEVLGVGREEIIAVSAKTGENVELLLDIVCKRIPAPEVPETGETKALIFDSVFDPYRGVVTYVRVVDGHLQAGKKVYLVNAKSSFDVLEVGHFTPRYEKDKELVGGEIGYIITGLKTTRDARVGDTIWIGGPGKTIEDAVALPGYAKVKPFVFASVFPLEADEYPLLRDALEKYILSDSALVYEPTNSSALGHGFRCGFLGLLHMEIVQERLEREFGLSLLITSPSVPFKLRLNSKKGIDASKITSDGYYVINTPSELPPREYIDAILEPYATVEIVVPGEYIGQVMDITQRKRGIQKNMSYLNEERALLTYEIPMLEIIVDFYDQLKSVTSGYASMNYEPSDYREGDLVRLDILVADESIESLSTIVHRQFAEAQGRVVCKKLKDLIPRALFPIAVQAAIGSKVVARETIPAMRKDVTAKLYGGDVSRKMKLLKKQKEGKKRMKQFGKVTIPQDAFLSVLKREE